MKKKICFRGIMSVLIALAMLFAFMPFAFAADGDFVITELSDESWSLDPIPLLIIKISYDANNNGKNDFDISNGNALYADKSSELYGEQWCYSSDKYWYDTFFSDDKSSMKTYYKEVSNGSFYFYPAEETYASAPAEGVENDGVVEVVVPYKHPHASTQSTSTEDSTSRMAALTEAAKYVDFAKFDKNGDGYLSYTELAIVFVCGGYEASGGTLSDKLAFGVWAHHTSGSGIKVNGVSVGTRFVRIGEYLSEDRPNALGTVAHELGHFIGAPDLYDTNKTSSGSGWKYAGDVSLMASGSWNSYSGKPRGTAPAYMDPYNAIECGLLPVTEVYEDGEYTMYSRHSSKGKYNVLKVRTANPKEYYLIENRYHEEGDTQFDAISSTNRAIMIWHIDENIAESAGNYLNTSGKGHDPGVAVMGVSGISTSNCGFKYVDNSLDGRSYTFESNSSKYRFPISGTSYTSATAEEASTFSIKITVKEGSYAGDEMVISINTNVKLAPDYSVSVEEKQPTALSFKGRITDLFGGDVTSAKAILSKKADATEADGVVKTIAIDAKGNFVFSFDGLEPGTKYFCKVIVEGKNGSRERTCTTFTMPEKKERTDYYEIFLYKGLTAVEKRNRVKVKPGETLKYSFPMEKRGYDFCGWYLDSEYKERYDMGFTQTVCNDFALYAKWVETGKTASLKLVGAESKYLLFACEIGDNFDAPVPAERVGYKFVGWYADEALTVPYDFGQKVEESGEITIYAKWESTGEVRPETTTETKTTETTTSTAAETTSTTSTTSTKSTAETTSEAGSSGCKSVMGAGASFAIIAVIGAALAVKKKKDNE